jgi:Flp pilus assembly protein TadD
LYRRGDFPQAFALAQEAVTQIPDHPEMQAHFGLAAAAMGQTEVARKALEVAVALQDRLLELELVA